MRFAEHVVAVCLFISPLRSVLAVIIYVYSLSMATANHREFGYTLSTSLFHTV